MADRYWVGGPGAWTTASTTVWSATSGGASGASVPTSADNVIFDALSGLTVASTVTITGGVCANLSYTPTAVVGYRTFSITDTLTISGTFSTSGTAGNVRLRIRATTLGIATNMVVATLGAISDIDFIDVYVTGAAAPLTGTRLGNIANGRGVTFSTPKTVYWNLAGANQIWSANGWAATSGGTPSTDNFPLVQDTAVFNNTGIVTGAITMDTAFIYYGNIDMSARTTAMTISTGSNNQIYGNWTNGSGTTLSGASTVAFQTRTTQTITSAGKAWSSPITVSTFGGTVQLGDALNLGGVVLTITSGSFITNGYAVTANSISANTTGVRSISLGSSVVTLASTIPLAFTAGDGLTFNAGTSNINVPSTITAFPGLGLTYYDLSIIGGTSTFAITGANTFHNLTVAGARTVTIAATQTFTGSLVYVGAPTTRLTFTSDTVGTPRTLIANGAFSSTNIDFQDIAVTGTSAPISGSTLGDLQGNSGITFTSKTVYWNLAGAQLWTAAGWALTSGGTPNAANFPLAQDTAVFDNTGSVTGTITFVTGYAYPNIDISARTTAMTLATVAASIYGDWKNGSGTTLSGTGVLTFSKRSGTQTITSAGKTFVQGITIDSITGTTQLADAFTSSSGIVFTTGTFSAGANNITGLTFASASTTVRTINMGSGTWTATGTGTVWSFAAITVLTLNQETANILLSNTTTTARTFAGGGLSYNKLTIGGATGTSTTTFSGANNFTELASTKTVAHTVALSTTAQAIGKWTITGTVGNVVTVTGVGSHSITGDRVTGVDYLALGTTSIANFSEGEFYAGANSTATTPAAPLYLTAAPTATTRYWVGGTGTWDATTTTNWSATSGGAGGASVPTSADNVIFDSLSNATAYTVTQTQTGAARCANFTMGAPLTGNITFASGASYIVFHGNVSFSGGANITRTYTGNMGFASNTTGWTFNPNGVTFASQPEIHSGGWSLTSALTTTSNVVLIRGSLDTAGYAVSAAAINSSYLTPRTLSLGASTVTLSGATPISFGTQGLTFNAGTSTLSLTNAAPAFTGAGFTYYNVTYTVANTTALSITGANTFNNLTFTGGTTGVKIVSFAADQTFMGALTTIGTTATGRITVKSSVTGTTRTFTANSAASISDIDFQDIAVVGTAAPISGTRLGDLGGNSGITLPAKTVYWNLAGAQNWSANGWAATSGGSPATTNFPLAQDTAVFDNTGSVTGTITTVAGYAYPTIDMSARTTAMTLATIALSVYGDWRNGSGTTLSGTAILTFVDRGTQTITSAGKSFTQPITINSLTGTVQLADALTITAAGGLVFTSGAFDAIAYNVTSSTVINSGTASNTVSIGSGTWTVSSSTTPWVFSSIVGLTFNKGTGSILLSSSATGSRVFAGGGLAYPKITMGGTVVTDTIITGNNTFAEVASTKTTASSISLQNTIQIVGAWTAAGTAGNLLTASGTSAAAPAYLVLTGSPTTSAVDYLNISNVRATPLATTWYAGANSVNSGSLGWIFLAGTSPGTVYAGTISESATSTDAIAALVAYFSALSETATSTDTLSASANLLTDIAETATATDANTSALILPATLAETATATDADSATLTLPVSLTETITITDAVLAGAGYVRTISETATTTDANDTTAAFLSATNETATATDAETTTATLNSTATETATATDVNATTATLPATLSEAATATDTSNPALTLPASLAETATIADTVLAGSGFFPVISESSTVTDTTSSTAAFAPIVTETATATDAETTTATLNSATTDTATTTDDSTTTATLNSATTDTVTATDAPTSAATFRTTTTDTATATDTDSAALTLPASLSETATATDSDSSVPIYPATLSETATATDADYALQGHAALLIENGYATDSTLTTAIFTPSVAELATATDFLQAGFVLFRAVDESATATDTIASNPVFLGAITETAIGTDATSTSAFFFAVVPETAAATDALTTKATFNALAAETTTATEDINAPGSTYNAAVLVAVTITDNVIGAYLWNPIDDNQTANWQNVTDTQSPGWTPMTNVQAANWQNITDTQAPGWTSIPTPQAPNWTDVQT